MRTLLGNQFGNCGSVSLAAAKFFVSPPMLTLTTSAAVASPQLCAENARQPPPSPDRPASEPPPLPVLDMSTCLSESVHQVHAILIPLRACALMNADPSVLNWWRQFDASKIEALDHGRFFIWNNYDEGDPCIDMERVPGYISFRPGICTRTSVDERLCEP